MTLSIGVESITGNLAELAPLYRAHHAEMRERLASVGLRIADPSPDLARYERAEQDGTVVHIAARVDGEPVGYANFFVSRSLHHDETEAVEDMVYVAPQHRGRIGRKLIDAMKAEAKRRGARWLMAGTTTDPRAAKLYERLGFTPVSTILAVDLGD